MSGSSTKFDSALSNSSDKLAIFLEIAQKHRARLMRLAWRMTSGSEEAEDIVQEALLRAFKALPAFRGDSQMGTWLHKIVRNATLEYLRNRKGRIELPLEPFHIGGEEVSAHEFPDPGESPEAYCERRELEDVLRSAMSDLTSPRRVAMQMCIVEELPYRLVASDLNVSIGTLKSRVYDGKRMLKRAVYRRARLEDRTIATFPIASFKGNENDTRKAT